MVNEAIKIQDVDHFVQEFENGNLHSSYNDTFVLPGKPRAILFENEDDEYKEGYVYPSEDIMLTWFGEESKENYNVEEGFFPFGDTFEFTTLWYAIVENYMDHYEVGDWSVEHGGLRFEYWGGAKNPDTLKSDIETLWPLAHAKYHEVTTKLLERGIAQVYVRP